MLLPNPQKLLPSRAFILSKSTDSFSSASSFPITYTLQVLKKANKLSDQDFQGRCISPTGHYIKLVQHTHPQLSIDRPAKWPAS